MYPETLTPEEMESLKKTRSEREWNAACDVVRGHRGGQYPSDWFPKVLASGLLKSCQAAWISPR